MLKLKEVRELINHVGVGYVSYYDVKKQGFDSVEESEIDDFAEKNDIIILPYKEELLSIGNVLSDYANNTGTSLPKKITMRVLRDLGLYNDFIAYQRDVLDKKVNDWCQDTNKMLQISCVQ